MPTQLAIEFGSEELDRFDAAHPWYIPEMIRLFWSQIEAGAKRVSVRREMEYTRIKFRAELGAKIAGVGRVGLNNNLQGALTREILRRDPRLKPYVRIRER